MIFCPWCLNFQITEQICHHYSPIALMNINVLFFALIALVYSSAGFGGGSLYLAILAQSGMSVAAMRSAALSCNALVTATGTFHFYRASVIPWRRIAPLLLTSVPLCILTSFIGWEERTYFLALAAALFLAAVAMLVMWYVKNKGYETNDQRRWWLPVLTGAIGALAGFTGIGGGVYLAPFLYLIRWAQPREIAATSALFILINSLASLLAMSLAGSLEFSESLIWFLLAVALGAQVGARMAGKLLSQRTVHFITVVLLIFAAIRVWSKYL
jgi:uncharacterized membrane protein YfcA